MIGQATKVTATKVPKAARNGPIQWLKTNNPVSARKKQEAIVVTRGRQRNNRQKRVEMDMEWCGRQYTHNSRKRNANDPKRRTPNLNERHTTVANNKAKTLFLTDGN